MNEPMKLSKEQWRIKRGDIYNIVLGHDRQAKPLERPVLVVQNDIGNRLCGSVIVVPMTPLLHAGKVLFAITIPGNNATGLDKDYVALFSQIRTLDKERFGRENLLGHISVKLRQEINEALEISLGLSALQELEDRMNKC